MQKNRLFLLALALFVILASNAVQAAVKLPGVIGDNMVLQRGQPVPIWGWADTGDEVTVAHRRSDALRQGRRRRPLAGDSRRSSKPANRWK